MAKKFGRVTAIIGAQLGSEGKGVVAHKMADEFDIAIRTGAPNAGHSFVQEGKLYKMQSIPCTFTNRNCLLVLGAGALINLEILFRELDMVRQFDPNINARLKIDGNAGILEDRHHHEEGGVNGSMHKRMGSTGEGVGPARRDRIARDPEKFRLARDVPELQQFIIEDSPILFSKALEDGSHILLEGTQGSGLSLVHGAWPFVTSSDTNAAQLAADAGIPPQFVDEVILVARTYPIRVAGNSGPLHGELSWDEMSVRVGKKVVEYTTVTKKQRRIGEWDEAMFSKAVALNAPTQVALTFMDYLAPEDVNKTKFDKLSGKAKDFIHYLERSFDVRVSLIGTGWSETEGWVCVER